jgi:hypothetical protein
MCDWIDGASIADQPMVCCIVLITRIHSQIGLPHACSCCRNALDGPNKEGGVV